MENYFTISLINHFTNLPIHYFTNLPIYQHIEQEQKIPNMNILANDLKISKYYGYNYGYGYGYGLRKK